MDPKLPNASPVTGAAPTSNPKRPNIRAIIIVVLAVLILIAAVVYAINRGRNEAENNEQQSGSGSGSGQGGGEFSSAIAPQTFVYGTWSGDQAFIKTFDLQTGELGVLANLTDKIKNVTVLDPEHLLFIYNTNPQDHGTSLANYSLVDGVPALAYSASEGFGIDSYVVSPNRKYVAVWEVKFRPGSNRLSGGSSRVYTAELSDPSKKNLIYDEVQQGTTPVHYPLAITNSGEVFTDQFLPNTLRGWGYGMSKSNFSGSEKEPIADMPNGSYGSQPSLSPNGRYLVFTGYSTDRTGVNPQNRATSLAGANTIALYDVSENSRSNLSGLSTNDSYISAQWDSNGDVIYWMLSGPTSDNTGMYLYDLSSKKAQKLPLTNLDTEFAVATLQNGKVLVGVNDTGVQAVGNLGPAYSPPFNSMYVVDANGTDTTDLNLQDNLIQYITLLPANYFAGDGDGDTSVQANGKNGKNGKKNNGKKAKSKKGKTADTAATGGGDFGSECTGFDNLQLCPFYFKAQLEPKRETQQTIPACYEGLIGPECERRGFTNNTDDRIELAKYRGCIRGLVRPYRQAGLCGGSPLYLYGNVGDIVNVTVGTDVFGAVPSYNNGYVVRLGQNGKMEVNGGTFERLSYDYTPGISRIVAPNKGVVVAKKDVAKAVKNYAVKLGLNEKETEDLLAYAEKEVISPYVYISFFDQKTSEQILPLSFSPKPDSYLNVVFYFRLLSKEPPFSVHPPVFPEPLQRTGLTAVEVSAVVQ